MSDLDFKYARPPIREVGLSVMAAQSVIEPYDLRDVHKLFADRYPRRERQPTFPGFQPFPTPGVMSVGPALMFADPKEPVRYFFLDASGDNLVQVQDNFFARSWRRQNFETVDGSYPGYESLLGDFKDLIRSVETHRGDNFAPAGCELLYDNLIPMDDADGNPLRASGVCTAIKRIEGDIEIAGLSLNWFEHCGTTSNDPHRVSDFQSSISMVALPTSAGVMKSYLRVVFVARSPQATWDGVYEFFDKAHAHVRKRLLELTTPEERRRWE